MFIDFGKTQIKSFNGGPPTLSMPFTSANIAWPLIEPRRDSGKYIMGLFEAGERANGVKVHGVSTWTTPKKVVDALSAEIGRDVVFKPISSEVFASFLPPNLKDELLETMLLVGDYSYYGPGTEKNQADSDKWLVKDADLISYPEWVKSAAPWKF